jgi:hypothetical protein
MEAAAVGWPHQRLIGHTETGVKMRAQKAPFGERYHEGLWPYGKGPITE